MNIYKKWRKLWCISRLYQLLRVYEQYARVRFQIDPLGLFDDFETLDRDILLVGQAEAHQVEHR